MGETVKLSRLYEAHNTVFDEVKLREPKHADYMKCGPISEWQPSKDGPVLLTFHSAIAEYLERLVEEPGVESIQGLALVDSLKLEAAVKGFFTKAKAKMSPKQGTSSSSSSDGTQEQSDE